MFRPSTGTFWQEIHSKTPRYATKMKEEILWNNQITVLLTGVSKIDFS